MKQEDRCLTTRLSSEVPMYFVNGSILPCRVLPPCRRQALAGIESSDQTRYYFWMSKVAVRRTTHVTRHHVENRDKEEARRSRSVERARRYRITVVSHSKVMIQARVWCQWMTREHVPSNERCGPRKELIPSCTQSCIAMIYLELRVLLRMHNL